VDAVFNGFQRQWEGLPYEREGQSNPTLSPMSPPARNQSGIFSWLFPAVNPICTSTAYFSLFELLFINNNLKPSASVMYAPHPESLMKQRVHPAESEILCIALSV
jgi:hypothetical protein